MSYFSRSSSEIQLEEIKDEFKKLNSRIENLLYILGSDCKNLHRSDDIDKEFYRNQYRYIAEKLESIYNDISYLDKSIVEQGFLKHNDFGRYSLPNGEYFTTGSSIELLHTDPVDNEQYWVLTPIAHNGEDYYAKAFGKQFSINGMLARIRK